MKMPGATRSIYDQRGSAIIICKTVTDVKVNIFHFPEKPLLSEEMQPTQPAADQSAVISDLVRGC